MAGLFSNQSTAVDDIQVGFNVPAGDYTFEITDIELKSFSEGKLAGQSALIVELTVVNECPQEGMTFDHFLVLPDENSSQEPKRTKDCSKYLKQALLWYGVPESKLETFDPETEGDAIIGQRGIGVLRQNGAFTNLTSFELTEESGASDTSVSASAVGNLSDWAS